MNLITPFDFIAMMPERQTVAIVGNAPSLRGGGLGGWIEGHDVVVRFNDCAMRGYEDDIGSRTDVLVSNPYTEKRTRPLLDQAGAPRVILILNPQTRRGDKENFAQWIGEHPVLFSYTPDIKSVSRPRSDMSLTTGTYAISLLGNLLKPKQDSIVGFTMFLAGATAHYWSDETASGIAAHNPSREAEVFIDLINSLRSKVVVGEDVRWVAEVVGVPLRQDIEIRALRGWSAPSVSAQHA